MLLCLQGGKLRPLSSSIEAPFSSTSLPDLTVLLICVPRMTSRVYFYSSATSGGIPARCCSSRRSFRTRRPQTCMAGAANLREYRASPPLSSPSRSPVPAFTCPAHPAAPPCRARCAFFAHGAHSSGGSGSTFRGFRRSRLGQGVDRVPAAEEGRRPRWEWGCWGRGPAGISVCRADLAPAPASPAVRSSWGWRYPSRRRSRLSQHPPDRKRPPGRVGRGWGASVRGGQHRRAHCPSRSRGAPPRPSLYAPLLLIS